MLFAIALVTLSNSSFANKYYADVHVTDMSPQADVIWVRENQHTPKYPIELARAGIRGCAVLSFTISPSGDTTKVEIINAMPTRELGKQSRKMLKKWQWIPAPAASDIAQSSITQSKKTELSTEQRTLRLDFCMGGQSTEQSQKLCQQQAKIPCV